LKGEFKQKRINLRNIFAAQIDAIEKASVPPARSNRSTEQLGKGMEQPKINTGHKAKPKKAE
jgi:hypothetical protein